MSAKQRKIRAKKRAYHAKHRIRYSFKDYRRIGINSHEDGDKVSTMDRLLSPTNTPVRAIPSFEHDLEELIRTTTIHSVTRALEALDINHVQPKLRDKVAELVEREYDRDDLDDPLYASTLYRWQTWLPTQGLVVLVDPLTGLPVPSQTIELIVVQARVIWERSAEKLITPTSDNIVTWLSDYGQRLCKVQDYLGLLGAGISGGFFSDIYPEFYHRIRTMCKATTFVPGFSHLHLNVSVTNIDDLMKKIASDSEVPEKIDYIKRRNLLLSGEMHIIDSLPKLSPGGLNSDSTEKPTDTPYGDIFYSAPKDKDDA